MLDGDPRELQNPAQSAKGEERGDHERNPWLAKMVDFILLKINQFSIMIPSIKNCNNTNSFSFKKRHVIKS